jgi:hypothetical protein
MSSRYGDHWMNEKLMTGSFDEVNAIFTCGTVIAQAGRQAGRQAGSSSFNRADSEIL